MNPRSRSAGAAVLVQAPARRFSEDLQELLARCGEGAATIGELESRTAGRGIALLIMLLATPFLLPIPTPFLSTPVGLAIALMGVPLALGRRPWLPAVIRRRQLRQETLHRIVHAAQRVARPLERLLKPRLELLFWPPLRWFWGAAMVAAAFVLCLPLPVPFSNGIPALAIILLAAGLLQRDGLCVLAGAIVALAAWGYVFLCWNLILAARQQALAWLQ